MKYFMIVLLITLLTINGSYCSWSSMTSPLKSMWLSLYSSSEPSIKSSSIENDCRGCAQNHVEEDEVDPILTELRVEYVKQQILRKLRLEKPPEVSLSLSTLPKPLINGHVLELKPGEPLEPQIPAESFYGKTNQIVVFPDKGIPSSKKCQQSSNHITGFNPAVCFTFFLPNEMQFVAATSAELWFYKEKDKNDNFNQTFVLSELDHWDQRRSFEKNTIMAIFETTIGEGWVKTDVSFAVRKWVEKQRLNHSIQIACSTCKIERNAAPVSLEARLKPFLVVQTSPLPQRYRPKRNSNCQPEMKECCRDELYISFEDIGWSDWILHPSGYHAYFCRGSCSTAVSLTMSGTHHNDVIRIRSETELLREGVLNMAQGAQYIYRGCISCNHEIHHLSSFVSLRRSIRLWSFLVSQSECAPSTVWFSDFDILYFLYKSLCLFYINNLIKGCWRAVKLLIVRMK